MFINISSVKVSLHARSLTQGSPRISAGKQNIVGSHLKFVYAYRKTSWYMIS